MIIIRDLAELESPLKSAVVTIGNFDGVHLGHREIFRKVVRKAGEIGGNSVVFTFVPHPVKILAPQRAPLLINTYAEKERLIEASCIDVLICAPFNREFAALSAAEFVEDILVKKVGMSHLVVGYDYAFGRGREGDIPFLRRKAVELGFTVAVLEPIRREGEVYSSSRIRSLLTEGDVKNAARLLGRHFNLEGLVVHGAKRGKQLGFPTANLQTEKELLPRSGVYAVKVRRDEEILDGVVNIGCNPTFQTGGTSLELHILDFSETIYGETLRIYFFERLRDEKRFSSPAELTMAIEQDIEKARDILTGARIAEYREYLDCGGAVSGP